MPDKCCGHHCLHSSCGGCEGHSIRAHGAGHCTDQSRPPGGKKNILLHYSHPVLGSPSAHFRAFQSRTPTLGFHSAQEPAHSLHPARCLLLPLKSCESREGWDYREPCSPTFRPRDPHLRSTRTAWLCEHPISSHRYPSTQHSLGFTSSQSPQQPITQQGLVASASKAKKGQTC